MYPQPMYTDMNQSPNTSPRTVGEGPHTEVCKGHAGTDESISAEPCLNNFSAVDITMTVNHDVVTVTDAESNAEAKREAERETGLTAVNAVRNPHDGTVHVALAEEDDTDDDTDVRATNGRGDIRSASHPTFAAAMLEAAAMNRVNDEDDGKLTYYVDMGAGE